MGTEIRRFTKETFKNRQNDIMMCSCSVKGWKNIGTWQGWTAIPRLGP